MSGECWERRDLETNKAGDLFQYKDPSRIYSLRKFNSEKWAMCHSRAAFDNRVSLCLTSMKLDDIWVITRWKLIIFGLVRCRPLIPCDTSIHDLELNSGVVTFQFEVITCANLNLCSIKSHLTAVDKNSLKNSDDLMMKTISKILSFV